jgi:hypothetical protein
MGIGQRYPCKRTRKWDTDCSTYLVRELSGQGESLLLLAGESSRDSVESALSVELDSLGETLELGRDGRHCELFGEVV